MTPKTRRMLEGMIQHHESERDRAHRAGHESSFITRAGHEARGNAHQQMVRYLQAELARPTLIRRKPPQK